MADRRQQYAQELLDRFEPMDNLIQELCDMADAERRNFHIPQALLLCEEGIRAARETGDLRAEGICLMHRWAVYYTDRKLTEAIADCKQGRSKLDDVGDTFSELNATIALGMTYEAQGSYFKSFPDEVRSRTAYQNALHAYRYDVAQRIVDENRQYPTRRRAAIRADDYETLLDELKSGFKRATTRYVQAAPMPAARPLGGLDLIPVLAQPLPAGKPLPTLDDIEWYARVMGDRAHFGGDEYKLELLGAGRGAGFAPNLKDISYFIAPIKGDSMNQTTIQDGDFVLLQRNKAVPVAWTANDIVAAVIEKQDSYFTLKQYIERGGKLLLEPQSTNPAHKTREFTPAQWTNQVKIAAVAVAVLKKVIP